MSAKVKFAALLGFVGIGISSHAFAVPIVVDFTGAGSVCTYTGFQAGKTCEGKSFAGTITYEIVGPTPIPAGPPTRAISQNGWVDSSFAMQWDTGAYASVSLPTMHGNVATQSAQVLDDHQGIFDGIVLSRTNGSYRPEGDFYENLFSVVLWSRVLSWQSGLDFPTFLEMPPTDPIFGPVTEFEFRNYSTLGGLYSGYVGLGSITSLTTRLPTTTVAEPGSAALLAMGLVALYVRRRRT